jgi:hypothetical protein
MNPTEALNRIVDLLGLKFKSEKFAVTKLEDGVTEITNNKSGDDEKFAIGDVVYVIKDSMLIPASEGDHLTRDGIKITLDASSVIVKMEEKSEDSDDSVDSAEIEIETEKEDMMSSDTLADGTKIETDEPGEFKVGQKLYVITESGEKVNAPTGEHTTKSGITLVVNGEGVITGVKYPDQSGEGSLENEMKKMKEAMSAMVSLISELNKFKTDFESIKKDFEEFKAQPDRVPVVKKFAAEGKDSMLDWKLELLKNTKR